jgi:tetratricopeptide (TPR) repeat protein
MALTDLSKHVETVEQFINDLAETFRSRRWVKLLSLCGVVFAIFLNPSALEYLKIFEVSKPQWYSYRVWGIGLAIIFGIAFAVALFTRREKAEPKTATANSIIKGLLPYTDTKEDAEWFARLQRNSILHECIGFCTGADSSFAIFSGESGAGKTSLLRAGLLPNLDPQKYQPVYVKLTDKQPLRLIRRALTSHADETATADGRNLLALLRLTAEERGRAVILILDQFEQFFTHYKTKEVRREFIRQMAEWHKQRDSVSARIIVCIRGDFANRMNEFQQEMEYTLTPHNNLSIEKFQPQEAARVISAIAKEAKINLDESFVINLTKHELADREDGTVSPVDIQILCSMVNGQKDSEERAFNLKAFQKLGGVEGLLERFLSKALAARETEARRKAAINVMLALTDQNVRAGTLTLADLRRKLSGVVSEEEIGEAISWLVNAEVRLVTAIQEEKSVAYELAHERIIPPLRRIAFKEITEAEKAQRTLDRRVNEWIGNDRTSRYLLTLREWRLIKRHRAIISLGSQKEQKKEFVALSKRRFVTTGLKSAAALVLGYCGYVGYKSYEEAQMASRTEQPPQPIPRPEEKVVELVKRNKVEHKKVIVYAVFLLSTLEKEEDRGLYSDLWDQVVTLSPDEQLNALSWLAKAYIRLGKVDDKLASALKKFQEEASDEKYVRVRVPLLKALAEGYANLGNANEALDGLDKVFRVTTGLDTYERRSVLATLTEAYGRLPKNDKTVAGVEQIEQATESYELEERASLLSPLIDTYKTLGRRDRARSVVESFYRYAKTLDRKQWFSVLPQVVQEYRDLGMQSEAERIFQEGYQSIAGDNPAARLDEFSNLAKAESILKGGPGGGGGGGVGYTRRPHVISPLVEDAVEYAKRGRLDEALRVAARIPDETDEISALCKILIVMRDVKNLYALDVMFRQIDARP